MSRSPKSTPSISTRATTRPYLSRRPEGERFHMGRARHPGDEVIARSFAKRPLAGARGAVATLGCVNVFNAVCLGGAIVEGVAIDHDRLSQENARKGQS